MYLSRGFTSFHSKSSYFQFIYFMCVCAYCIYLCVPHACLVPIDVRRGCHIPGTGVLDGCEPPRGCWEPSTSSLQEQSELLKARPSLPQPLEQVLCHSLLSPFWRLSESTTLTRREVSVMTTLESSPFVRPRLCVYVSLFFNS